MFTLIRAILLLFLLSAAPFAEAHKFVRASRIIMDPTFVNKPDPTGFAMELALYSRLDGWEEADPELTFWNQEEIAREILGAEDGKFAIFDQRQFMTQTQDGPLIDSLRQYESLLEHSDILALYNWPFRQVSPENFPPRQLVALLAIHRGKKLLLEGRHNVEIERPPIVEVPQDAFFPWHWRLYNTLPRTHQTRLGAPQNVRRHFGWPIQVNAAAVDRAQGKAWLPFLYSFAYWHGLFTTGQIIPEGEFLEVNNNGESQKIAGPAIIIPSHFVGEAYSEAHRRTYQKYRLFPSLVSGVLENPDRFQPNRKWSLIQATAKEFITELPSDIAEWCGYQNAVKPLMFAPLALGPINGFAGLDGNRYLNPQLRFLSSYTERFFLNRCSWSIALAQNPKIQIPFNADSPQLLRAWNALTH